MRQIKFRGQTIGGEWVTGNLSILEKDFSSTVKKGYYISNSAGAPFAFMVRPESVGQFTGLKDKNGVDIYLDDIYKDEEGDYFKVIQLKCGRYALKMIDGHYTDDCIDWSEVKIIGNIHTDTNSK